jgi:hypothetical protein
MATARTTRGRRTEEAVAEFLRQNGWPFAERNPASLPGRDVKGVPGVAIECKARRQFDPKAWSKQAARNAEGDLPAVVMRPDGMGETTVEAWPVFLTLAQFVELLHEAGYGTPLIEREAGLK